MTPKVDWFSWLQETPIQSLSQVTARLSYITDSSVNKTLVYKCSWQELPQQHAAPPGPCCSGATQAKDRSSCAVGKVSVLVFVAAAGPALCVRGRDCVTLLVMRSSFSSFIFQDSQCTNPTCLFYPNSSCCSQHCSCIFTKS